MSTYTPPPGRPRSTPPMPNGSIVAPLDTEGAIAAYVAGVPTAEIRRLVQGDIKHIYPIMDGRGIPRRRGHYNKKNPVPSEPALEAATLPDSAIPPRPVRKVGQSKHSYGACVQRWMRATDPAYDAQCRANVGRGSKKGWAKRRRLAEKVKRASAAMEAIKPAPLTLWQRIKLRWAGAGRSR